MSDTDYKQKIIEMVEEIENEDYIFKIYHFILPKYRRDKIGCEEVQNG